MFSCPKLTTTVLECLGWLLRCSVWLLWVASDFRRFEAAVLQGKSPTMEMLFDWGTTNCTVGDLVEILIRHQLFAAVSVLLPDDEICRTKAGILTGQSHCLH